MDKEYFYEWASSNKNVEKIIIDQFEVAEEKDHLKVTYILASSVPNANGALLTKGELEKAKDSIIDQPLIIVPDWDNLPTGHSLEEFPKLSWGALVVGTHISSELIEDENEVTHLKVVSKIWSIRYPEISNTVKSLYDSGDLQFSMEARFNSQTIEGATRTLHGVSFIGSAIVDQGANPFSYALEVAQKQKRKEEEKPVNFEEAIKKLKDLDADVYLTIATEFDSLKKEKNTLVSDKEKLETSSKALKETLETANSKIDELSNDLNAIKEEKEKAELAQKQEARFKEIAQFIDFKKEEVASKKEAYGKMDDEIWSIVLETAKRNKKVKSNVEFASDTRLDLDNPIGFLDGLGE